MKKYSVKSTHILLLLVTLLAIGSCSKEEAIPVIADFSIIVEEQDFSVPVRVRIINRTEGADTFNWTFEGADRPTSTDRNPGTLVYEQEGNFTIRLEASNRDESSDTKEIQVPIDAEVVVGFNTEILVDNFPPMEVAITNTTLGADTFNWLFQDGSFLSSTNENPENVVFSTPGEHTITLEVSNGLETYETEQTLVVAPHLEAVFNYEVAFQDDDLQVPVTVTMVNNSISATSYNWTFTGGTPSSSTDQNPVVVYNTPGTYTLEMEATNGKETQTVTQQITVVANTNIRTFENLQLGINTSHNNNVYGAFFSTVTREVYSDAEVLENNGALIDIAFFALNEDLGFNKFVSPDQVQTLTFDAIPNATHTKFINVQESCNCNASLTEAEFDAITDDTLLNALTITETAGGLQNFDDNLVPRIVLFETQDQRKGAIKIKQYVTNGQDSYIIVDIKVQKE